MFDDNELFPSRFYNNKTFPVPNGRVIQIAGATQELVKDPKSGEPRPKVLLSFVGVDKPIIANRTNYEALTAAFGRDGAQWIGRSVTVTRVPVPASMGSVGVRFLPIVEPVAATVGATESDIPF